MVDLCLALDVAVIQYIAKIIFEIGAKQIIINPLYVLCVAYSINLATILNYNN